VNYRFAYFINDQVFWPLAEPGHMMHVVYVVHVLHKRWSQKGRNSWRWEGEVVEVGEETAPEAEQTLKPNHQIVSTSDEC